MYALGHAALPLEGRLVAALLYGGQQAVLSHTTAAWVWSLIDARPTRIHATTPGHRRSLRDVRFHRCRDIDRTICREYPATSVARTLLDVAATLPFSTLRRALAEAEYHRLLNRDELESVVGKGRVGSRALRTALDAHLPQLAKTLSILEERFLELCDGDGIPIPEVNAQVGRMRVDALWREKDLVVELDGASAHGGWAQVSRDRERELALRRTGFRVLRYTWRQVTDRPSDVAADLRQQLGLGERPPLPPVPPSLSRSAR